MNKPDYFISVNLSKLINARRTFDTNPYTGEEEDGLFIPIKNNLVVSYNNSLLLWLMARHLGYSKAGKSHLVYPYYKKEDKERLAEEGVLINKFIGSMQAKTF